MKQLTIEEAEEFANSGIWKEWTDEQIVRFQLFQNILCMDINRYHKALENVLKRPVHLHEFSFHEKLIKEYLEVSNVPSFEEIVNMIPEDQRYIIGIP